MSQHKQQPEDQDIDTGQNTKDPIVLLEPTECKVKAGSRKIRRSQPHAMRRILDSLGLLQPKSDPE